MKKTWNIYKRFLINITKYRQYSRLRVNLKNTEYIQCCFSDENNDYQAEPTIEGSPLNQVEKNQVLTIRSQHQSKYGGRYIYQNQNGLPLMQEFSVIQRFLLEPESLSIKKAGIAIRHTVGKRSGQPTTLNKDAGTRWIRTT